jgi:hydroxymethylpyrimidine/phosphomethylpyrimidine kinase
MKTVLTIAGYDPSSGAGVTADLMVFAAHGLFGTSCITGLTVQSTLGVRSVSPVDASTVAQTLDCLHRDLPPPGIKIGMTSNSNNCLEIARYIAILNVKDSENPDPSSVPIVLDPVLQSSSGRELLDGPGFVALREHLLPLVSWITPNIEELALLSGKAVKERDDIPHACRLLQQATENQRIAGKLGILATGGHLDRPDDYLLTPDGEGHWLSGERVETQATHGTGCALSSAFLSHLVLGENSLQAAIQAKAYVLGALQNSVKIGNGHGPMNYLWQLSKVKDSLITESDNAYPSRPFVL